MREETQTLQPQPDCGTPREYRFRQSERLRLRTLVERLFVKGDSHYEWPLRAVVLRSGEEELSEMFKGHIPAHTGRLQMMVTVPKRKRRRAVDRVQMRRRVREAWRLNRLPLWEFVNSRDDIRTLSVAIVYVADKNVDYAKIERSVQRLISRLMQ